MDRAVIAFLISAIAVLFGIAPLLRADVPGWQIATFAAVSVVFVAAVVWRMTAPAIKLPRGTSRPLTTDEIRNLVTPIIRDLQP